jgi:hypothetical protein
VSPPKPSQLTKNGKRRGDRRSILRKSKSIPLPLRHGIERRSLHLWTADKNWNGSNSSASSTGTKSTNALRFCFSTSPGRDSTFGKSNPKHNGSSVQRSGKAPGIMLRR